MYKAKAHIEDGKVMCACSDCTGCAFQEYNQCVDVEIRESNKIGEEIMKAKEDIKKDRK
jgi:hypothetical protein